MEKMVIIKARVNYSTTNIRYNSHHLSADGAVNSTQPGAIPPVSYNAGTFAGKRQHFTT